MGKKPFYLVFILQAGLVPVPAGLCTGGGGVSGEVSSPRPEPSSGRRRGPVLSVPGSCPWSCQWCVFMCTCGSGLGAAVMLCYSAPLGKKNHQILLPVWSFKKNPKALF